MIIEVYIPPMSGGFSVVPVEGSNKQIYDADLQEHVPDFRLTPASFKIEGWKIEGTSGSEVTTFVDLTIHEFKDNEWKEITSTNGITIDYTSGLITVSLNNDPGTTREFRADFKVSNPYRPGMPLVESQPFNVTCVIEASSGFRLVPGYPQGRGAHVIKRLPTYGLACPVFKGNEEWIQAFYRWYRVIDNVKTEITRDTAGGITGYDSSEIRVPFGELNERGNTYECVADPVTDLVGVNLISKAMISDDWNALAAGISTPGEDADGKYFAINQYALYSAFNKATDDIFGGKIKYKTNQRYMFNVKWKLQGALTEGNDGLILYLVYTDGSRDRVGIPYNQTTGTISSINSAIGKTIEKIVSTYGANTYRTNVYDIQLVEYFGESSIVTGGAYARIPANGVASGNMFVKFPMSQEIADQLNPGMEVTLSIEDVKVLAGNPSGLSWNIYDGVNMSTGAALPLSSLEASRTLKNNPYSTSPGLSIYGGNFDNMVGNAIEIRGVMLVIGDKAYKYSPADGEFIPAIADGAPKPALSSNALSEMMVLNKVYPAQVNKRDVLVDKSNNLDGGNAFVASCKLDTASGTIEKPELSYSCLWKSRDNGIWSDFGKGFTIAGAFDKKLEIASFYEKGLDNAKWAANFNGIDQYLGSNNPSSIYPWGGSTERIHVIEFIVNEITSHMQAVVSMCITSSGESFGFALAIATDGRLQYRVGKQSGATSAPTVYCGTTIIQPGKLYRVEVTIAVDGTYTAKVNGVPETFKGVGGALYASNHIRIGLSSSEMYLNGKVLRYIVHNNDNSVYAEWDFQPTGGDRANMLKRKKADGSIETANKSDLAPQNVPDIDVVDPENGFFVTI